MKKEEVKFKEIGRIPISATTELVLSEVHKEDKLTGYSITKYITSTSYTGFSKGVYIPEDYLIEFLKLFSKENLEYALDDLSGPQEDSK